MISIWHMFWLLSVHVVQGDYVQVKKKILSLHVSVAHARRLCSVVTGLCNASLILLLLVLSLSAPGLAWAKREAQADALPPELEAKANAVCAKTDTFNCYANNKYGYLVAWPHKLLTAQGESDAGDGQIFSAADGQAQLTCWARFINVLPQSLKKEFEAAQQEPGLQVTYKHMGKNFFVVSGISDGKIVYRKTVTTSQVQATFVLTYAQAQKGVFDPLVGDVANSLIIFGR